MLFVFIWLLREIDWNSLVIHAYIAVGIDHFHNASELKRNNLLD